MEDTTTAPNAADDGFTVTGTGGAYNSGGFIATATPNSTFEDDLEYVDLHAVHRNARRAIIGYAFDEVDYVPGNGAIEVEVVDPWPPLEIHDIEIVAQLGDEGI